MRRSRIEEEDFRMVRRQQAFRVAADVVAGALSEFAEVEAVAVIGSVARPLWKEVPRFGGFRRKQIMIWHECGDLDLAVWVTSCERLEKMRQARDQSLAAAGRNLFRDGLGPLPLAVTGHQAEVFLFEPETDRYLGRLCNFSQCPKGKPDCETPGCGAVAFNKVVSGFVPWPDLLETAAYATLYRRGQDVLMSALDLPEPGAEKLKAGGPGGG
ncbi:MAG: hypothetical protein ACK40A_09780 [Pannonibacter indicus]